MQPLPEPQAARQAPPGIVRPHFESASLAVIVAGVMQALAAYVVEVLATMPGDGHGKARHDHREHLLPERRDRWRRSSTAGKPEMMRARSRRSPTSNGWPTFTFENLAQLEFLRDHANA